MGQQESQVLQDILKEIGCRPDFRLFRNNVGVAEFRKRDGGRAKVRYGLAKGSSDLVGVLLVRGIGVAVFIEVKTDTGRLRPEQETFLRAMQAMGAVCFVAHSGDEARQELDAAKARILAAMEAA